MSELLLSVSFVNLTASLQLAFPIGAQSRTPAVSTRTSIATYSIAAHYTIFTAPCGDMARGSLPDFRYRARRPLAGLHAKIMPLAPQNAQLSQHRASPKSGKAPACQQRRYAQTAFSPAFTSRRASGVWRPAPPDARHGGRSRRSKRLQSRGKATPVAKQGDSSRKARRLQSRSKATPVAKQGDSSRKARRLQSRSKATPVAKRGVKKPRKKRP